MKTLTVSAKGQVTLRKDILRHLGVRPGEQIVVDMLPAGRIQLKAAQTGKISDVFDALSSKRRPSVSVNEIKEISARGWAGKS